MMISEFTSIFELAAGLNAAFVVVEYSRSFSKQLYENAFKFDSHIDNEICTPQELIDEETLQGLESVKCGENETGKLIEKIRRDKEKLNDFITQERTSLKATAKTACELRSHSGLSLLNFIFCLFVLLLSPFEAFHPTITQYLVILVSLSILVAQIICWIEDASNNNRICMFNSLTHSVKESFWLFITGGSLSVLGYGFLRYLSLTWKLETEGFLYLMYFAALLPYLNFVVFTFIFKRRLQGVQNEIRKTKSEVAKKCDAINALANKVNTVSEVSHMLEVTD